MTDRDRRARPRLVGAVALLGALGIAGQLASGCSSPRSSTGGTTPSTITTSSASSSTTTRAPATSSSAPTATTGPVSQPLASLPVQGQVSSSYRRLLAGSGSGDKTFATVAVTGRRVFVQTVCSGPGSLTLVKLFAQGPCNNQAGVTSFAAPASHEIRVVVRADRTTKWAIYISQPA